MTDNNDKPVEISEGQISLAELLALVGDDTYKGMVGSTQTWINSIHDLLEKYPGTRETYPVYEAIYKKSKRVKEKYFDTEATLKALQDEAERFDRIRPFLGLLKEAQRTRYEDEAPSVTLGPINRYIRDRGLETIDAQAVAAHRDDFLTFFDAYAAELEKVRAQKGAILVLEAQQEVYEALRKQGILKGDTQPEAQIDISPGLLGFGYMRNNELTNGFLKSKQRPNNYTLDEQTGDLRILEDGILTVIEGSTSLKGKLSDTTRRLLVVMIMQATANHMRSDEVKMRIWAFMDYCGLSDYKSAREQVDADLELLFKASISNEKGEGITKDYRDVRICSDKGIENGEIAFTFGQKFFEALKRSPMAPLPASIFKLNLRRNPNAFSLGFSLSLHKYMNAKKANEGRIRVKTLLAACSGIPRYEDIKNKGEIARLIKRPFNRDLKALADTGDYTLGYQYSKGGPVDGDTLAAMAYDDWAELIIAYDMPNYPSQDNRLAGRERHFLKEAAPAIKAKQKREAGKKKPRQNKALKHDV